MPRRGGPAARLAVNPAALVAFVDYRSHYVTDGIPKRTRLTVNGIAIAENDARMIRRWRVGTIQGVTANTTRTLLDRYGLSVTDFLGFCICTNRRPTLKGTLNG